MTTIIKTKIKVKDISSNYLRRLEIQFLREAYDQGYTIKNFEFKLEVINLELAEYMIILK